MQWARWCVSGEQAGHQLPLQVPTYSPALAVQVSRRGNIIKGYTGYLTESKITHNRAACNVARDRVFSSTSTTGWPWPGG